MQTMKLYSSWVYYWTTRSVLGRAHLPPTMVFRRLKITHCCFEGPPIPVRAWGVSTPQNHALLLRLSPITSTCMDFPNIIKFHCCSAYAMGEKNPVLACGLWHGSGSKVNQFFRVPTSVDTQHFIQIHTHVFE